LSKGAETNGEPVSLSIGASIGSALMPRSSQTELPIPVRAALERFLEGRAPDACPLTITFATGDFAPLLANWLAHASLAGETAPLVIVFDDGLADALRRDGVAAIRHPGDGSLADLWAQRALFFEYLARRGIDFLHSDLDAVWLRDPRPLCFADAGLDIVFSQGTNYPAAIWRLWGFVLCCGLFAVRATPAAADFFSAVRVAAARVGDDQVAINHLLAENALVWNPEGQTGYTLRTRDQPFTAWRRMLTGTSDKLDLRIGLLPYHLAPRLPEITAGAAVRHPIGPGNPTEKAAILAALGCWRSSRRV
jgi:hypothetical protein